MLDSAAYIPIIFLVIAIVMAIIFFTLKRKIRLYAAITHILSFIFMFCIVGAISLWITYVQMLHLIVLILFFLLGAWHTWSLYKFQSWSRRNFYLAETLFTLFIIFSGGAGYLWTYHLVSGISPNWIMAGTILPFLLPFLVHKSFFLWRSIPDKIYYVWQYSDHLDMPEPVGGEAIILHFYIKKRGTNAKDSRFTVKAPLNMKVGDIFHYFLHNYNQQHPDHPVLANSKSSPFGWYFYIKSTWWKKEIINPNISVYRNQLTDDVLIHAKKVYLGY